MPDELDRFLDGGAAVAEQPADAIDAFLDAPAGDSIDAFLDAPEPPRPTVGDYMRMPLAAIAQETGKAIAGVSHFASEYGPTSDLGRLVKKFKPDSETWLNLSRDIGRDIADRAMADYNVSEAAQKSLGGQIIQAAGSIVPIVASGPAALLTGAGMSGEGAREEAFQTGASEDQQAKAFILNSITGAVTEKFLGVPALFKSAKAAAKPVLDSIAKQVATQAVKSFAREGAQETLQQFAQDAIAKWFAAYDPERNVFDVKKLWKTFWIGGSIGSGLGATMQLAAATDARLKARQATMEDAEPIESTPQTTFAKLESSPADRILSEVEVSAPPTVTPIEARSEPILPQAPESAPTAESLPPSPPIPGVAPDTVTTQSAQDKEARIMAILSRHKQSTNPDEQRQLWAEAQRLDQELMQEEQEQEQAAPEQLMEQVAESNPPAVLPIEGEELGRELERGRRLETSQVSPPAVEPEATGQLEPSIAAQEREPATEAVPAPAPTIPSGTQSEEAGDGRRERQFGQRFVADEQTAPEIRQAATNLTYEPIPNRVTSQQASEIIDQRGLNESIRLIRDETSPVSFAVRSTIGLQALRRLNEEYVSLRESDPAGANEALAKASDLADWQMEYGTRLGQGVQAFAMWNALPAQAKVNSVRKWAEKVGKDIPPEDLKEITDLALDVDAKAEGMPRNEALEKLNKRIAQIKGFQTGDLPIAIFYANILSGYNTQIVNALDTGLNVLSEVSNMAIANPRAAPLIFNGLVRGIGMGKADAVLSLREGRRITEGKIGEQPGILEASTFGREGGVPVKTDTLAGRAMKRAAESTLATPLNAWKYVGRLMAASDAVFYRGAEEAKSALLAFRAAQGSQDAKAEAARLLGYDRINEFRDRAKAEGYRGAKLDARATELMQQSRPEHLREEAGDFAGLATYNHAPEGALGVIANMVSNFTNQFPAAKVIVPFTRIVANVTNRGLDYTPWGYKRALAGYTKGDPLTGDRKAATLAKATAGTLGLVSIGLLDAMGVISLHGAGPSDPERKKQLQAAGWKPYTIQIGDTYISYLPTPLGLGLSTLANYLDADRYKELNQKDAGTRVAYSLLRIPSTIFQQSFLSGISGVLEALSSSSPGKQISELKKFLSRTASGFTVPSLAKDINRLWDSNYRDSDTLAEDVIRDIPVARLSLRPTLNAFGEEVKQPKGRFFSIRKESPEWRLVVDKNLRIPVPDETTFTKPEAGYEYQKLAGEGMKKFISSNLTRLRNLSEDQAQELIEQERDRVFKKSRETVRRRFPNALRKRKKVN